MIIKGKVIHQRYVKAITYIFAVIIILTTLIVFI
jgi:hypothetical protein